jgi:hypothetical protein
MPVCAEQKAVGNPGIWKLQSDLQTILTSKEVNVIQIPKLEDALSEAFGYPSYKTITPGLYETSDGTLLRKNNSNESYVSGLLRTSSEHDNDEGIRFDLNLFTGKARIGNSALENNSGFVVDLFREKENAKALVETLAKTMKAVVANAGSNIQVNGYYSTYVVRLPKDKFSDCNSRFLVFEAQEGGFQRDPSDVTKPLPPSNSRLSYKLTLIEDGKANELSDDGQSETIPVGVHRSQPREFKVGGNKLIVVTEEQTSQGSTKLKPSFKLFNQGRPTLLQFDSVSKIYSPAKSQFGEEKL